MSDEEKKDEKRWLILRARLFEEKIKDAFGYFRENGIEPIMIKGWAAARLYPESYLRYYSDIDLCVAPELYVRAVSLLENEKGKKLTVDLHSGLRHLDTVGWEDLFENSRILKIDETEVRVLRPEDHLRVLCVHWLTDGGAYKEKLKDIIYILENHRADFDWDRCLGSVGEVRRQWIIKTVGLAVKYYDLDVSSLPFADDLRHIPRWLIKTLEKEWSSESRLMPLHTLINNKKEFWKQIKKRIPPNAIQATIDMEGRFDDGTRVFYQVGSIFVRLKPSVKRLYGALKIRFVKNA